MPDEYSADSIEILSMRDAVRRRPGMYVGDTADGSGTLHLALEILSNAVDQVLLAHAAHVDVRVDADDVITITDDGPGIPAALLITLLERPHDRPTFDGHRPHVHLSRTCSPDPVGF
jgi:DNA gyrase/topoisomerase IV subunit B